MKALPIAALVVVVALCVSGIVTADGVAETWTCNVKEGKTIEDVQAVNSRWLKWINANVEDGGITSSVGTSVVGTTGIFIFVDSFPNLASWAAARDVMDSDEGEAFNDQFDEVSECSENRLWNIEDTK